MANLRAQATMEYLVTYGWALLALFGVVAILVSTGAFSSSNFSTSECTFQPDLPCSPFIIYLDGGTATLRYTLANNLGFPVKIAKVTYKTTGIGEAGTIDNWDGTADCVPQNAIVQSGGLIECNSAFPGSTQPSARDFKTIIATIDYLNCGPVKQGDACDDTTASGYRTSGRISAVVEQGNPPAG